MVASRSEGTNEMKFRIFMATATAASVLMTVGAMADGEIAVLAQIGGAVGENTAVIDQSNGIVTGWPGYTVAKATQEGNNNALSITQNGRGNWAGTHMKYSGYDFSGDAATNYNYILQKGDSNTLEIDQTGNGNQVAFSNGAVNQAGDRNEAYITQIGGGSSGGLVNIVTQTALAGAASLTNKLTIMQSGAVLNAYSASTPPVPLNSSDYNYALELVSKVVQTHTGGDLNDLYIDQSGGTHNAGNTVTLAEQTGSGNDADIIQSGRKNLLSHLEQIDDGNVAYVSQTGYNNVTARIYQDADATGNNASVILNGIDNGQDDLFGAAAVVGTMNTATVWQSGAGNAVQYEANGNDNSYGFYQNGIDNKADNILINGSRNHLGVYQSGTENELLLADINGNDNVLGVKQLGTTNKVSVTIGAGGNNNGGYTAFSGLPASSAGLTAGFISQNGTSNEAVFEVTGSDNLFASLQEGLSSTSGDLNKINAVINGSSNQAAIVQLGNSNNASLTQTGGSNNALIQQ